MFDIAKKIFYPNFSDVSNIVSPSNYNIILNEVQALFLCPNPDCRNFFITYYQYPGNNEAMKIVSLQPSKVEMDNIPDVVKKISPMFVSIYEEALTANSLGLKQISGAGCRKAVEFLIKDYAKHKTTSDKFEEIESLFAGNVINNFINDSRLQNVSKRALWLGNDETHYLRLWKDHDINDLIKLTIHWIEMEQLTNDYTTELS